MSYLTKSLTSLFIIGLISGCSLSSLPPQLKTKSKSVKANDVNISKEIKSEIKLEENLTQEVKKEIQKDDPFKEVDRDVKPYYVNGKWYYPIKVDIGENFEGVASWYGPDFHGRKTSNGENYDMYDFTAAHKTLPFNTMLKVTNLKNSKTTIVRVNDRGPFVQNRLIDLSFSAAKDLDIINFGTALVKLEVVGFNREINFEKSEEKQNLNSVIKPTTPKVEVETRVEIETKDIITQDNIKKIETTKIINLPEPLVKENSKAKIVTKQQQVEVDDSIFNRFSIQIGAFKNLDGANKIKEQYSLVKNKYKAEIKERDNMYKVWLTGFNSYEEADKFRADNDEFSGAFIIMGE